MKQTIYIDKFLRKRKISRVASVLKQLWDKKAENVIAMDISKFYTYADFIIVCSGTSVKHTQSIADAIYKKSKDLKKQTFMEGYDEGNWILLDLGDVVIHIFTEEMRKLYNIEGVWYDAPTYEVIEN